MNPRPTQPAIVVYTKPGCHLCDDAIALLRELQPTLGFSFSEINIMENLATFERFKSEVPVGMLNGTTLFRWRTSSEEIRAALVSLPSPRSPESPTQGTDP